MASKKQPAEPFEALYTRLEQTVAKLEQGNLSLEESLSLYEEGMNLAKRCQEILQGAELRITRLQEQFSEGAAALREEPPEYEAERDFDEDEPGVE
jgi:exodeoxyribonuclease VII small subunit